MTYIDLNHVIEDGTETYPGLPAPHICDFWSREQSARHYDDDSSFHIGRIDMVANTGTYLDAPFHRYSDGIDIAGLALEKLVDIPGVVIDARNIARVITPAVLEGVRLEGRAILFLTGWDRHWGTGKYFTDNPCLSVDTARMLVDAGAALVGMDSLNVDDTTTRMRPVHSALLGAGIPIVEHLCRLDRLPQAGFRFNAVPPRVRGMGTFPVRAFAALE